MKKDIYKLIQNQKPLRSEDIDKHKDFDALLSVLAANKDVPGQPRGKMRLLYTVIGISAAALLGFMFWFNGMTDIEKQKGSAADAYFAKQDFINPPLPTIKTSYETHTINATTGARITYDNGSFIDVPEKAFINGMGNYVEGPVEIKYREFHDFVDFFASGIPMSYDSAGVHYQLESAGMIEVYAEQNGEKLDIAEGKGLEINLVHEMTTTADDPKDFNIYELDSNVRNWVYKGKNKMKILEEEALINEEELALADLQKTHQEAMAELDKKEQAIISKVEKKFPKPTAPTPPQKANEKRPVFNLDFENVDFSTDLKFDNARKELQEAKAKYQNVLWQVLPDQEQFNQQAAAGIEWKDMKLKQVQPNEYELTLIGSKKNMTLKVQPVLSGEDFENAMAAFNQEFAEYQTQLQVRNEKIREEREKLLKEIAIKKEAFNNKLSKRLEAFKREGLTNKYNEELIRYKVLNNFRVTNVGVWNCDRPLPPWMVALEADFVSTDKKDFDSNVAFLVNKSQNTLGKFYVKENSKLYFPEKGDKMLWILTSENKLAVYQPEKFKDIKVQDTEHTFVMDVIDREIQSEEDLREILSFD